MLSVLQTQKRAQALRNWQQWIYWESVYFYFDGLKVVFKGLRKTWSEFLYTGKHCE